MDGKGSKGPGAGRDIQSSASLAGIGRFVKGGW